MKVTAKGSEGHCKRNWRSPEGVVMFTSFCSHLHHLAKHHLLYTFYSAARRWWIVIKVHKYTWKFGLSECNICYKLLYYKNIFTNNCGILLKSTFNVLHTVKNYLYGSILEMQACPVKLSKERFRATKPAFELKIW